MKKRMIVLPLALLFQALLLTPGYAAYFFDTGTPDTSTYIGSYDLKAERPLIAAQFTSSEEWNIGSIEGYFMTYPTASNLTAKIWQYNNTNIPGNEYLASASTSLQGDGFPSWQGVYDLDWTLPAGTWWVGFTYDSGGPAYIVAGSPGVPDDSPWEVQYAYIDTGDGGAWQWYIYPDYNYSLRIGDTSAVPLPAAYGCWAPASWYWRD